MRCFFSMWRFDRETTVNKLLPPADERHFNCLALRSESRGLGLVAISLQKIRRPKWIVGAFIFHRRNFTPDNKELKHEIILNYKKRGLVLVQ